MPRICLYELRGKKVEGIRRKLSSMLAAGGAVTVLFFLMAWRGIARADADEVRQTKDVNAADLRVFEFSCEFHIPVGQGRLDGLMAARGSHQRIAIYWVEPDLFRESATFLRYSDFLFTAESVRYWIHGMSQPATLTWSETQGGPLLPAQNSLESAVRSALTILSLTRGSHRATDAPLEVVEFFRGSRGGAEYVHGASSSARAGDQPDARILNSLPHGRKYSKLSQGDGTIVWCVRKTSYDQTVASVRVKPLAITEETLTVPLP